MDLSKSSWGGIFGTKKRSIKTEGFDRAHACPILRRKNTFGRLSGIILGFPRGALLGPGHAASQPQDLPFWGAKALLGGCRGSFWASRSGIFGNWARCIKTWTYFDFLGVHHQRHPCSLSSKIQKIDVSEQGGFIKIIPRRHFWHLHQKTEGFQRP